MDLLARHLGSNSPGSSGGDGDGPSASALASASLNDPYRPSFFELFAQEQLRDLLSPALRYVLSVLAQRNPRYLLRIVNRFEEIYALGMFAVERHYLRTWGSSFAENFYGLRRRRRPGVSTDRAKAAATTRPGQASYEALREREIGLSLLFLVGLPYLQAKAKEKWESMGGGVPEEALFDDDNDAEEGGIGGGRRTFQGQGGRDTRPLVKKVQERAQTLFRKGYPYATSAYQLWLLVYHVRYLFGKSPYWRPWLRWMRVDVRRVAQDDYPNAVPLLPPDLPNPLREPLAFATALLRSSPFIFFEALKYALPASIFFFKFLEWWYSADNPRRRRGGGGGGRAAGGRAAAGVAGGGAAAGGGDGGVGAPIEQGGFGSNVPLFGPPSVLMPSDKGILYKEQNDDEDVTELKLAYSDPRVPAKLSDAASALLQQQQQEPREGEKPGSIAALVNGSKRVLLHNSCPLCGRAPVANPCMLPTGYVFCYTCAHAYVDQHGACPVTGREVIGGKESLRRVLG